MKVHVTARVPLDKFRSEWDDRLDAAHEFSLFAKRIWDKDLAPLTDLGIQIKVTVDVGPKEAKMFAPEIRVEPYTPEVFDMMQKTRELLTDEEEIFKRFCKSPEANSLYSG
jgi:hypothetical protein